jgi:uncharacterized surface protein with fasciclin (FAS1) repeats
VEQKLGNPSFTPALVASMEVAEVCKVLLGEGETLHHRKLSVNLLEVVFVSVDMKDGPQAKVEGNFPTSPPTAKDSSMKDILDTLKGDGSFRTLLGLVEKAGLTGRLLEPGPFTLFAPNDEAFQRVNLDEISGDPDSLLLLLNYHLVEGKLSAAEIAANEQLMTVSDKSLTVRSEEDVQVIDNARYLRTDLECTNGIIQVIDNVFLPQFSGWYCSCC